MSTRPEIVLIAWPEVVDRFGSTNSHRAGLTAKLHSALLALRAAGCQRVWLNGSYTTDKETPGDVDVLWDAHGVVPHRLPDELRYQDDVHRTASRAVFGGDYFAVDHDSGAGPEAGGLFTFFSKDRHDRSKPLFRLELTSVSKKPP